MFSRSAAWYDAFYRTKDYAGEARRVTDLVRARNPRAASLLDVACGTGRHLAYLREHFDCAGVDLDPGLLAVAARRLPGVPLVEADMTGFDLGRRFDAVTCLYSSIGYTATVPALHAAIGRMAAHLHAGGVLVVEPWLLPEAWTEGIRRVDVVDEPGRKLVRVAASRREGIMSVLRMHYAVAEAGEITSADERHELRLFTRAEYLAAFAAAGLEASWDPDGLTGRGLLVAQAPAPSTPARP